MAVGRLIQRSGVWAVCGCAVSAAAGWGGGQFLDGDPPEAVEEVRYSLFNRAPVERLRPVGTEPHPYTMDPGWFQYELSLIDYGLDHRDPDRENRRAERLGFPLTLKVGLLENVDFQVAADLYSWERQTPHDGRRSTSRGFGDVELRSKINLWGNDGGETALSLMPFAVLPTRRDGNSYIEGGLMIPSGWEPGEGWWIEWTPTIAAVRAEDRYESEFGSLLVANREVSEGIEVFAEFDAVISTERGDRWAGVLGTGVTIALGEHAAVDAGVGFGLTRAAEDFSLFLAVVQRF